ncbi:MAG TPA: hypothetical protein VF173_27440 [Thermoanaerobaculia bacterium]|nr:hypothetical protein [Thermoanaerobaculia bacterium]
MRDLARSFSLLLLFAGIVSSRFVVASAEDLPSVGKPWISLSRLGPVDVDREQQVVLTEAVADLAGEVWNYGPGDEIAVLFRRLGEREWSVAAQVPAEPGGLFQASGLRFPEVGNYELIAGLFRAGTVPADGALAEERWSKQARAVSGKLSVRITAPPLPAMDKAHPGPTVLTVGGMGVDPQRVTPVPARGEVVVQAPGLAARMRIYLAICGPYSDRCHLHGPAGRLADRYVLPGVSFELPGDPRQTHFELIALASAELLAAGAISLQSLRRRDLQTSPTIEVVVDEKWAAFNDHRVPYLVITRIGSHDLGEGKPPAHLAVEQGVAVEVGRFERIPEGARLWILTRPRASLLWRVQGPAQLRGTAAGDEEGQPPPQPTWVWDGTRFEDPEKASQDATAGSASEEFEVLAVLSTATLPDAWIDSAYLGSTFILTLSPPVTVEVTPAAPVSVPQVSIQRVGTADVDPEEEVAVGAVERVEVTAREELPPTLHVYLARHPLGSPVWSLTEAIPQGRTHVVPALSFTNPHAEEGTRYQLIAIVTSGLLPAEQLDYDDLVRSALASSEVVTVRYETGGLSGFWARLARSLSFGDPPPAEDGLSIGRILMSWITILLVLLLPFVLAAIVGFLLLRRKRDRVALLAREAANRIEGSPSWFSEPAVIRLGPFLFGIALLVLVLTVILRHYLPLYAVAVAAVTHLSARESAGLARWLVLLTGLAGVLFELTYDPRVLGERRSEVGWLRYLLGFSLMVLMLFQAAFYYTFLSTSDKTAEGTVPVLGGFAFFLIAFVEAMAFFFITRLTLEPSEALLVRLFRLPRAFVALFLRLAQRWFEVEHPKEDGDEH